MSHGDREIVKQTHDGGETDCDLKSVSSKSQSPGSTRAGPTSYGDADNPIDDSGAGSNGREHGSQNGIESADSSNRLSDEEALSPSPVAWASPGGSSRPSSGPNLNMLSALMHVGSDLLRSATTLVEALVILHYPR